MTDVYVSGFKRVNFDKRELKAALRRGGAEVRREARKVIARRAVSKAGEFPGYQSGALSRSIKVKVASGGGYVTIMPYRTPETGKDFYAAYLVYGTKRGLKKRKAFMVEAYNRRKSGIRAAMVRSLRKSLTLS